MMLKYAFFMENGFITTVSGDFIIKFTPSPAEKVDAAEFSLSAAPKC